MTWQMVWLSKWHGLQMAWITDRHGKAEQEAKARLDWQVR